MLLLLFVRGSFLAATIAAPFWIYYLFKYGNRKTVIATIFVIVALMVPLFFIPNLLPEIFDSIKQKHSKGNFSSGRLEGWNQALSLIPNHPLFGSGPFVDHVGAYGFEYWNDNYHSSILHTLVAMGSFGLIALFIHWYETTLVIKNRKDLGTKLIYAAVGGVFVAALLDVNQHNVFYMSFIVILLSVLEIAPLENIIKKKNFYDTEPTINKIA